MAGKQYEVVRPFRRVDPETGDVTLYEPGETYSGPLEPEEHYTGSGGPDGRGPLVLAKTEIAEMKKEEKKALAEAEASTEPEATTVYPNTTSDRGKGK